MFPPPPPRLQLVFLALGEHTSRCVFDSCDSEGACWIEQATTCRNIFNRRKVGTEYKAGITLICTKSEEKTDRRNPGSLLSLWDHWHNAARHIRHIWPVLSDEAWAKMAACSDGATEAEVLWFHRRAAKSLCRSFCLWWIGVMIQVRKLKTWDWKFSQQYIYIGLLIIKWALIHLI